MQIQAAVEITESHRYRVHLLGGLPVTAEGDTRDQALDNFRAAAHVAASRIVEVVTVEVSETTPQEKFVTGDLPEPALTVGELPEHQSVAGGFTDAEADALFWEGIHRRRRELDEIEGRWQHDS